MCLVLLYGLSTCSPLYRVGEQAAEQAAPAAQTQTTAAERPTTAQELPEIGIPPETCPAADAAPQNTAQSFGDSSGPAVPSPTPVNSAVPGPEIVPDSGGWHVDPFSDGDVVQLPEAP